MKFCELRVLLRADLRRLATTDAVGVTKTSWTTAFNPRFTPVLFIRIARFCYLHRWLRPISPLLTWLNVFLHGIEFTPRCAVGPGLMLPHTAGTVVGAQRIGSNATIFQGVTLGAVTLDMKYVPELRPTLEDHVTICAGAKVLGGIRIGDGVTVGANAVVLTDVPANCIAVGVPAKVIMKNKTNG
jgi:serine O-acetyltransferase